VNFHQTTRRYNPKDNQFNTHHCENLIYRWDWNELSASGFGPSISGESSSPCTHWRKSPTPVHFKWQ
jgi:hypothetical protein